MKTGSVDDGGVSLSVFTSSGINESADALSLVDEETES